MTPLHSLLNATDVLAVFAVGFKKLALLLCLE